MSAASILPIGAVLGLLSVGLGAFGAHGLRGRLSERDLEIFETAVRYQGLHALALLLVGTLMVALKVREGLGWQVSAWGFLLGTLIFSGSLYLLVGTGVRAWGAVTPLGGLAFLVGWGALAWASYQATS